MTRNNDKYKKGFSGLSGLVSDVSEELQSSSKIEVKSESPKQFSATEKEPSPQVTEQNPTNDRSSFESRESKSGKGISPGKLILGFFSILFIIGIVSEAVKKEHKPASNWSSQTKNTSDIQVNTTPKVYAPITTKKIGLHYSMPTVGKRNVLSISEIRWCIKGGISIEAMRGIIGNNEGVDEFNLIVDNYNSRCSSYRYRQGDQSRAEREVEAYRNQIVAEAISEARQISPSHYFSNENQVDQNLNKPSLKYTKEAQQILTNLGYDPGPVDGQYGRRTADAIKEFQRDSKITEDGWIDDDILFVLRRADN